MRENFLKNFNSGEAGYRCNFSKTRFASIAIPTLIFIFGYFLAGKLPILNPSFYQDQFTPAVLYACGHGLQNLVGAPETLTSFLSLQQPSFSCDALPKQISGSDLNAFQRTHVNLLLGTGLVWKFAGVNWEAVGILYGIFLGFSLTAAYLLLKQGMSSLWAILGTLLLVQHLEPFLPHLRDFSKVPFAFLSLTLIVMLIKDNSAKKQWLIIPSLTGLVLGIGYGFRGDVLIFIPLFLVTLFLFIRGGVNKNMLAKCGAMSVFFFAFYFSALPVILYQTEGTGSNTLHVIILGLMTHFDPYIGILPSIYDWGHMYNDGYVTAISNEYSVRVLGNEYRANLATPEYDDITLAYYLDVVRNFPADMISRLWSVSYQIMDYPIIELQAGVFNELNPQLQRSIEFSSGLNEVSSILVLGAMLAITAANIRAGLFFTVATLYLSSFPFLQFSGRHLFHLSIIPIASLALICHWLTSFNLWKSLIETGKNRSSQIFRGLINIGALAVIFVLAILLTYFSRIYQTDNLIRKFTTIENLSGDEIPTTVELVANNRTLLAMNEADIFNGHKASSQEFAYMRAGFSKQNCPNLITEITLKYGAADPFFNFSRKVKLVIAHDLQYYFPVFKTDYANFLGVELDNNSSPCITTLEVLRDLPKEGVLPYLTLSENWADETLFQRSKYEPFGSTYYPGNTYSAAPQLREILQDDKKYSSLESQFEQVESVQEIEGRPSTDYAYIKVLDDFDAAAGDIIVVNGSLTQGKMDLGLQINQNWYQIISIFDDGDFRAGFTIDAAGSYRLVVANNKSALVSVRLESIDRYRP